MNPSVSEDFATLLASDEFKGMSLEQAVRHIGQREKDRILAEEKRLLAEFKKIISEQSAAMRMALRDSSNS